MPRPPAATNKALQCTHSTCRQPRTGWGSWCLHHRNRLNRYGHVDASAFPHHLRQTYQAKARKFLTRHRDSEPVQAALKVMHDLIYHPEPFLVANGKKPMADLKRLQGHMVDPMDALVVAAAVVIADRSEPRGAIGIPASDIKNECLPIKVASEILLLAPLTTTVGPRFDRGTGKFPDKPKTQYIDITKTTRVALGRRVMSRLGLFFVHLTAELQRREQEAADQHRAEQEALTGAFG